MSELREHDVTTSFSSPTTPSGRVVRDGSKTQDLEPGQSLGLGSLHPPRGLCDELETPRAQEEWGQGQGPKSLGVEPTYRNDFRTFHLPWTWMEESEIDRLRPWPGRGVKAEASSSQLRMSRLRREMRRVASAPAWVQPQQGPCSQLPIFPTGGLDQQGCFRRVSGHPHLLSTCCVPSLTTQPCSARSAHCVTEASRRGQHYSSLFMGWGSHRRGASAQSHSLRVRAHGSGHPGWVWGPIDTPLRVCRSFPQPSPPLTQAGGGNHIHRRSRAVRVKMQKG